MDRIEAMTLLQEIKHYLTAGNPVWDVDEIAEALDIAIEALRNEINCVKCVHYTERETYTGIKGVCKMDTAHREDLISRQDAIDAIPQTTVDAFENCRYCNLLDREQVIDIIKSLPSAEPKTGWIPFTKRPLTDEEKEEYPDWIYILDCPLPDDGQEILLSNGKYVWTDTFFNDDGCYLDGGDDIDEGMAWMPMPELYKGGEA